MFPTSVKIDEKQIEQLTQLYKSAYKSIIDEVKDATNFGRANRKVILAQIQAILKEFGVEVNDHLQETLPDYYEEGANQAIQQLRDIGAQIDVSKGFNLLHKDAIAALVDDASKSFLESLNGVNRSAQLIVNKALRNDITQRLATGTIGGEALKQTKKNIVGVLQNEGLDALVDKGGRSWTLDRYTEMLIRTKSVEARNRGLINRVVENNYDLVQVSSHGATDVCGQWEGKVLSLTGATPGYLTLAEAENAGLFHPNCKHAINVINSKLARETEAYDFRTGQYARGM